MDSLAELVDAVDSWWSIMALLMIGLYALAWKFGSELIHNTRKTNESIQTNHGSKNLGDAVDRLTDLLLAHSEDISEIKSTQVAQATQMSRHLRECEQTRESNKRLVREFFEEQKKALCQNTGGNDGDTE